MVDHATAVFGGFDGLTSALGVVAAGVVVGSPSRVTAATAASLAVAAAVSMAGGEWLADNAPGGRRQRAAVMGVATLLGSVLPALGFLFTREVGVAVAVASTLVVGAVVADLRPGTFARSAMQTAVILLVAASLSVAVSAAFGAG